MTLNTYCLSLRGSFLYYYQGQNQFGWLPISLVTGLPGVRAEWATIEEAQAFIDSHRVFTNGAEIL